MSDCTIEISTRTQGQTQLFRTAGSLEEKPNGVFTVCYIQENDAVMLTLFDRMLHMRREGEIGLSARFIEGKRTAMEMKLGPNVAEIPLHTDGYRMRIAEGNLRAALRYRLLTDSGEQQFELIITIGNSEEK